MNFYEHFYSGSQHPEDVEVLVNVMYEYQLKRCRFLEIGVLTGQTARGLKRIADEFGIDFFYTGIDTVSPNTHNHPRQPFPGAAFIQGDSAEVFHLAPKELDVVLLDGCHCLNHVMLEILHYGNRVVPGGFLVFHDTNPDIQQKMKDPHGPEICEFHNSVLAAQKLLRFPFPEWKLVYESKFVEGRQWGGVQAFQKQ